MQIYMYMYQILFLFNDFQNLEKLRMLKTLSLAENQIDKIGNTIFYVVFAIKICAILNVFV